ncbi:NADH-quinone oxidoreductase subunit J [Sodalis sp. CWE]|uniref:NADH-quinone oxidoreductase subunit J n=1 Tax=Sodalis sp. CWE TaxID=2803816 RepID=UPI001C7D0645|nr:NADH-quinone oxidoreductase subunit J [Sodalis sp. CWE]MBX4181072.1 NADH-quinone oxidoreductase subunit J [Sodalis sp. CWE]
MHLIFYFSGLLAILSTFRVITHTQPVYSLLYLIFSFLSISCVFFSLGAHFAGALEIIIYAAAIMVLFVFVIMVLNVKNNENKKKHSWIRKIANWIGSSMISLLFLIILIYFINDYGEEHITGNLISTKTVGIALFSSYILVVEIVSMLLLAGLIVAYHFGHDK